MKKTKHLCIMADDFGMHPAVNEGIVRAFAEGILTDSNLMAPAPFFSQAAGLTRQHAIPVGLHAVFTCEWEADPWGPLTRAPSLSRAGSRFPRTAAEVWAEANLEEARGELYAQYAAIDCHGISMTHVAPHMGPDAHGKCDSVVDELVADKGLPHRVPPEGLRPAHRAYAWDAVFCLSGPHELPEARRNLVQRLRRIPEGHTLWVTHPAVDDPALDKLAPSDSSVFPWARIYRVIDLSLLVDPAIRELIEELGIVPTPISQCPARPKPGRGSRDPV